MQLMSNPIETVNSVQPKPAQPSKVQAHLANERTYLAWMRTAIALMGFGVVIVRLRLIHPPLLPHTGISWKLGLMFSLFGLLTVFLSTRHYFSVCTQIEQENYKPTDRWIIIFSLAIALLGAGIIYFIFTVPLDTNLVLVD